MATNEPAKKQPRKRKSAETVRERAEKESAKKATTSKSSKLRGKIHKPFSVISSVAKKEYHPVPVPDNKAGKVLKKRVRFVPKFVRESWAELKLVTWPTKKEAARLTFAVIVFAVVFAVFVQALDYLFNILIKEILLR